MNSIVPDDPGKKRRGAKRLNTDQLPPHAPEAEQGVLGCCLVGGFESVSECEEAGLAPNWFYDLRHQLIYAGLQRLARQGSGVDVVTLHSELLRVGALEESGGLPYLSGLPDVVPSAANLPYYLEILREKFQLRKLVSLATEAVVKGMNFEGNVREVLGQVTAGLLRLQEEGAGGAERRIKPLVLEVIDRLEDYHRGHAQIRGMTTGLEYVDKLLCGFGGDQGNYFVLSGRPGTGKTSLATQIAMHAALDYVWWEPVKGPDGKPVVERVGDEDKLKMTSHVGVPVAIFSLEMTATALVQRMLFQRAEADMQRWRTGFAKGDDMVPVARAAGVLTKPDNIFVDDTARCTADTFKAKLRRLVRQHGIKLAILDYIQLMRAGGKRFRDDRVQELAEISAEIQGLGKELNIPIIVLAQMNRDFEKDPGRQPRLSDLKDCGSIEQDADLVGFLYKPKLREKKQEQYETAMAAKYGEKGDWSNYPERLNLVFAKNRYGPCGNCALLFAKAHTGFWDYTKWLKEQGQLEPAQGERDIGPVLEDVPPPAERAPEQEEFGES